MYLLSAELSIGDCVVRSLTGNPADTIIDGDHKVRCAFLASTNALLAGFTVRNGFGNDNGGGVRVHAGATLSNCWVLNNMTTNDNASNPGLGGGGVWLGNGGRVFNCVIAGNVSSNFGGGLLVGGATYWGLVRDCLISNNWAYRSGGGGCNYGGTFTMEDCEITGNAAISHGGGVGLFYKGVVDRCRVHDNTCGSRGAGIYVQRAPNGWVRDCLVTDNSTTNSGYGGGIVVFDGGNLANCTVAGNTSDNYAGGFWFYTDTATYTGNFYNNIIYGNNAAVSSSSNWLNGGTCRTNGVYYNCCTAPLGSTTWNTASTNNTDAPPQFADGGAGDYHVPAESPCVNTGTNLDWMAVATDLDGRRRVDIFSGMADMGCYEHVLRGTVFSLQ